MIPLITKRNGVILLQQTTGENEKWADGGRKFNETVWNTVLFTGKKDLEM